MLKVEKKLLVWIEKHMFPLMALLTAALALYLRRGVIWWTSPDVNYYFDSHINNVQSSFYYLIVLLTQYLPALPVHSVKWLVCIADYIVAGLCVVAAGGQREPFRLKTIFYFTGCILSPVAFLRGACWAQVDAVAFAFLLGACLLLEREKKAGALGLALIGVTLYPCFYLLVLGYLLYRKKDIQGKCWLWLGGLTAATCLLQGILGVVVGQDWTESVWSCVRWLTYDPYLGIAYREPLLWLKQMVNLFGYSAAMISGIAAYRHKISYATALLIHLAVLLVYGSLLFPVV